jgi:hypothetical protein
LTNGIGIVPVQFLYSDAVHGPEGPIPNPHEITALHESASAERSFTPLVW